MTQEFQNQLNNPVDEPRDLKELYRKIIGWIIPIVFTVMGVWIDDLSERLRDAEIYIAGHKEYSAEVFRNLDKWKDEIKNDIKLLREDIKDIKKEN